MELDELLAAIEVKEKELRSLYRQLYTTTPAKITKKRSSKELLESIFEGITPEEKQTLWMSLAAVWNSKMGKDREHAADLDCFTVAADWMKSKNHEKYADLDLKVHDVTLVFQFLKSKIKRGRGPEL